VGEIKAKVDTELAKLLPPLSTAELAALKASIKLEGVREPIKVDENGTILDGHHRFKIDKNAPTRVVSGKTDAEKLAFAFSMNVGTRRNMSGEQARDYRKKQQTIAVRLRDEDGHTQAKIAALLGVARETVRDWLAPDISNGGTAKAYKGRDCRVQVPSTEYSDIYGRVDAGETQAQVAADYGISQPRVNQLVNAEQKRRDKAAEREQLVKEQVQQPPEDRRYACIVIDPPWPMQKIERQNHPNQPKKLDYPTMTIDELREHPIPHLDDCHLYLWVTHRFLPSGLELIGAWGFKYECLLTWVKNVGFTPYSWMYSTEHVLFCRRGNLPLLRKGLRVDFAAPRREHSRKPDAFYGLVRQASPEPRVDMFSREKRDGFDQVGKDIERFSAE